ncbi:tRNA (adenosine(37)-N6)-dimethylallyltransferase MiaA [Candidatus Parcubacteria bacterium]|nr:tRNA (adenosine(37)-N6)-dimethylallyltransferase MiaA [Candidatus Parcubacteria bacterium]
MIRKQKVLVIVGPTASGKSALAVRLAKKLNGEIISADSRQVYKGLDIGTGKITKGEMRGIPHYLMDVADPKERFTAAEWKPMALNAIRFILGRNKLPIIIGGTGFYIDALTMDLPEVQPNSILRKKLEKRSLKELQRMLGKHKIKDPNNRVRLIRAIEIIRTLGKIPRVKIRSDYDFIWIGLKPKDLDKRIHERLLKRIPGILRETKKLNRKRAYELGLEYRFTSEYLQGKFTKKEFIERLEIAIRQYSKRQMTWFRKNKKIRWFDSASGAFRATTRLLSARPKPKR